jgi:nicotinamide mononucleotide transporter
LARRAAGLHLLAGVAGGLALGFVMHAYTDAALPWLDAMLTALSLVGQFWQNRRHVAAWWMWIAVDVVYIGMFANKQLFVTALLYVGFVALAVKGLRDWRRAARGEAAPT